MGDLQRLEYHLRDVQLLADVGSIERYRVVRKSSLGACNRLYRKATGDGARDYIKDIKNKILAVEYKGQRKE